MKNLKDIKRNIKNLLGKNNKELSIAADEIEESIPYKQRIAAASITEADAQFEIEKNKILNECEKQDLKTLLTNKLCLNMMNKSKNKSKKRIIKKDTSNLRNLIIIIICGFISACLSIGGLLISANTEDSDFNGVACVLFGVIMLVGIMINNLVVQNKLFDMKRLKQTKSNKVKFVAYIVIVAMCFAISVITNNVSMEYFLKSFKFNSIFNFILSIGFSCLFDGVPLLINSSKEDYNLCNYNNDFLKHFETENNTENNAINIDKNLINNITDFETRQQGTNTETEEDAAEENITENNTENNTEDNAENNTEINTENNARNTRKSNTHIRSFKQFEEVLQDTIAIGERVVPSKFNLSNCKTFDNWREKSKLVEKVNGVWIRVA